MGVCLLGKVKIHVKYIGFSKAQGLFSNNKSHVDELTQDDAVCLSVHPGHPASSVLESCCRQQRKRTQDLDSLGSPVCSPGFTNPSRHTGLCTQCARWGPRQPPYQAGLCNSLALHIPQNTSYLSYLARFLGLSPKLLLILPAGVSV